MALQPLFQSVSELLSVFLSKKKTMIIEQNTTPKCRISFAQHFTGSCLACARQTRGTKMVCARGQTRNKRTFHLSEKEEKRRILAQASEPVVSTEKIIQAK